MTKQIFAHICCWLCVCLVGGGGWRRWWGWGGRWRLFSLHPPWYGPRGPSSWGLRSYQWIRHAELHQAHIGPNGESRPATWSRGRDRDGRSWIGPDRRGEHKSAGGTGEAETGPGEAPLTGGVRTAAGGERAPPGGEGAVEAGRGGERAAAAGEGASAGGARTITTAAATEHAPPAEPRPLDACSHAHHVILCPLVVLIGWREGQEAGLANVGGFGDGEAEVRERAPPAGEGETAVLQVWVGTTADWERAPAGGEREAAASQRWTTDGAALVKHHRYGRVEKDSYRSYLFISIGNDSNICVLN